jgi:hypothetical protein
MQNFNQSCKKCYGSQLLHLQYVTHAHDPVVNLQMYLCAAFESDCLLAYLSSSSICLKATSFPDAYKLICDHAESQMNAVVDVSRRELVNLKQGTDSVAAFLHKVTTKQTEFLGWWYPPFFCSC